MLPISVFKRWLILALMVPDLLLMLLLLLPLLLSLLRLLLVLSRLLSSSRKWFLLLINKFGCCCCCCFTQLDRFEADDLPSNESFDSSSIAFVFTRACLHLKNQFTTLECYHVFKWFCFHILHLLPYSWHFYSLSIVVSLF